MFDSRAQSGRKVPLPLRAREKFIFWTAFAICVCYAEFLASGYRQGLWIIDKAGHPVIDDFVVFWTVGKMALKGAALSAYDWNREHAAELAAIGHPFWQLLGWYYPPLFLAVVMVPATLPYVPAFIVWCLVTLGLYAATVASIAHRRVAFIVACAAPWVPIELILGQNGFLSAAIIGLALLQLERRPALSGLVLGLLSFKPQLAILFPFALAAGGYWRAFGWAALGLCLWNGLAAALFGFESYVAFVHAMSIAADNHLVHSTPGWYKLQSPYGLARALGASSSFAWCLQIAASLSAALGVTICWQNKAISFEIKAALLICALMIATPYLLHYDIPIIGAGAAFLFRDRPFDKFELVAMGAAIPLLFAPALPGLSVLPIALLAALVLLIVALRRLRASRGSIQLSHARHNPA